jgi:hypothetical protein
MAAILAANLEKGSTSSAWTAGDQRGRGALQAIEITGSTDENIVTTRIDANSRACEMIAGGAQVGSLDGSGLQVLRRRSGRGHEASST